MSGYVFEWVSLYSAQFIILVVHGYAVKKANLGGVIY